jgi:hypothetical protein
MEYLIVENGMITNIIVADEAFAEKVGALPSYEGAAIGKPYQPASSQLDRIEAQITYTAIMTDTLLEG